MVCVNWTFVLSGNEGLEAAFQSVGEDPSPLTDRYLLKFSSRGAAELLLHLPGEGGQQGDIPSLGFPVQVGDGGVPRPSSSPLHGRACPPALRRLLSPLRLTAGLGLERAVDTPFHR